MKNQSFYHLKKEKERERKFKLKMSQHSKPSSTTLDNQLIKASAQNASVEDQTSKQQEVESTTSFIKKARFIMPGEGDSNNNSIKHVATNIVYQKSNVSRDERLRVRVIKKLQNLISHDPISS